jgi:hypothetical protein
MLENVTTGDVPFRKAYLRWLVDAAEVDDRVIRIHGYVVRVLIPFSASV